MAKFQFSPGRAYIGSIMLKNPDGAEVEIAPVVAEISVDSSVYDPSTTVTLTVNDGVNMITNYDLQAGADVKIEIHWSDDPVVVECKLIRVVDIVNLENARAYNMICVSKLAYASQLTTLSRSVSGLASDIAKQIFDEYAEEDIIEWEKSRGHQRLVIPWMTPLETLKWLAERAESEKDYTRMFFFQDSKMRYAFSSLENLIQSQKVKQTYVYNAITYGFNSDMMMRNIKNLRYKPVTDLPTHIANGSYASTMYSYDLNTKMLNTYTYSIFDDFGSGVHTNDNPMRTKPKDMDPNVTAFSNVYQSKTYSDVDVNFANDKSTLKRTMLNGSHMIEITVNGNPMIEVGNVVNVVIPSPEPASAKSGIDKRWSGNYLVIAKRDLFSNDENDMILTLAKDSLMESE